MTLSKKDDWTVKLSTKFRANVSLLLVLSVSASIKFG